MSRPDVVRPAAQRAAGGTKRLPEGAPPQGGTLVASLDRALDVVSPRTLRWAVPETDRGEGITSVERRRLLAPDEDHDAVGALLRRQGFRPVASAPWCRLPGASDWYGVDDGEATLVHVCLQRRLVLGSAAGGWLPIGDEGASVPAHSHAGASVSAMSRALALCEHALSDGSAIARAGTDVRGGREALHAAFTALFGPGAATRLLDAVDDDDAAALRRRLHELTPGLSTVERLRALARRTRSRLAALNGAGPRLPLLARRARTEPMAAIAIIGSDGSGKSTVSRWLAETLDAAFGARFLYFGTGDGPGSPLRRVLNGLKRRSRFGGEARPGKSPAAARSRPAGNTAPASLRLVWAAVVAWERLGKMRALTRARRARFVVVTDRYPQNEQGGIHDGPRLNDLLERRAGDPLRVLARFEQSVYARLARQAPDRVLLLDVPFELALQRRPEEPEAELRRRVAVARALRYEGAPRLVIDATEPLPTVKARSLRAALDALSRDDDRGL